MATLPSWQQDRGVWWLGSGQPANRGDCVIFSAANSLPDGKNGTEDNLLLQPEEELCLLVRQYLCRLDDALELRFFHSDVVIARLQHLHA